MRRLLSALAGVLLAGCTTLPPVAPAMPRSQAVLETFQLVGRLSLRQGGEGFSGNLDWRHSPARDEFVVRAPLGQGLARLTRDAAGVVLETADQRLLSAPDAETLTEQVLGARLPLTDLPRWVQARPVGEAAIRYDETGDVARIVEAGWQIDYLDYAEVGNHRLPRRIFAESGELTLRLVVDRWQLEAP